MLLNLSNHSYPSQWLPEQIKAANEIYGEVMNMPMPDFPIERLEQLVSENVYCKNNKVEIIPVSFPNIPPEWNEEQVQQLARDYAGKCISVFQNNIAYPHGIHVMGEFSFCFAFVSFFSASHYNCIVSTTKRIVETLPDGEKKSIFKFVKFRNIQL